MRTHSVSTSKRGKDAGQSYGSAPADRFVRIVRDAYIRLYTPIYAYLLQSCMKNESKGRNVSVST